MNVPISDVKNKKKGHPCATTGCKGLVKKMEASHVRIKLAEHEETKRREYPYLLSVEYSEVFTLDSNCQDYITCEFWDVEDWNEPSYERQYPCEYLIFDVCRGHHACQCSNGYEMTTKYMTDEFYVQAVQDNSDEEKV